MPERSSASRPCLASPRLAIVFTLEMPSCRFVAASTSAASTSTAPSAAIQRLRTTRCAQPVHERLARSSLRTCGQSRREPILLSTTGRSVIATSTLMSGISMPP